MMKQIPIKKLYPLALAEGEGVGTAYEYYAKRLLLSRWLDKGKQPQSILIAGLPQKYGASMDFLLLASEFNAAVTVIDDREGAIKSCRKALKTIQHNGGIANLDPKFVLVQDLSHPIDLTPKFDLSLSCEVLQRLPDKAQFVYLKTILNVAEKFALFTPNGDNPDHANHSGLPTVRLGRLNKLSAEAVQSAGVDAKNRDVHSSGYIDMPPFPTGLIRSDDQRQQATSGLLEGLAMWGLGYYARAEHWFPESWRRRKSHIVYSFLCRDPR